MKINLKGKRGFTTIDLGIALFVLLIFVVIMTSVSYSTYSASMEAKRTAVALNYAVDIFEHLKILDFADVKASDTLLDTGDLTSFEYTSVSTSNGIGTVVGKIGTFNITVKIEDYNQANVLKIITVTINYPVSSKKTETLELQNVRTIEDT